MDSPFPDDGQSFSYTSHLTSEAEQQSSCVSELTRMEAYGMSPPLTHEPPSQSTEAPLPTLYQHHTFLNQSPGTFPSMTSDPQYNSTNCHAWPSPPSGPDDFDSQFHGSSPTCGSSQTGYNPSPVSPETWSSPHYVLQQPTDSFAQRNQQESLQNLQICTPTSIRSLSDHGSQTLSHSTGSFSQSFESFDADIHGLPQGSSPSTIPDFGHDSLSGTNSPVDTTLESSTYMSLPSSNPFFSGNRPERLVAPRPREASSSVPAAKGGEPYAQLIYRAFMSRPDYSMSLQDLYQWFRENTDKAKAENKGWQNSIRHNLSMNKAFEKREPKGVSSTPVTIVGDGTTPSPSSSGSKRSTEWMLVDWAIMNGVESTTRYRPAHQKRNGRRHGSRVTSRGPKHEYIKSEDQHDIGRIPTRSMSSHKGGCSASRAKLRRHYSQGPHIPSAMIGHQAMHMGAHSTQPTMHTTPAMYPSQYGSRDHVLSPKVETHRETIKLESAYSPLTPETSAPDSFASMLLDPSLDPRALSAGAIHDATYALVNEEQGLLYSGPSQCEFPYESGDVTGVYRGEYTGIAPPLAPPVSAGGDSGHHFGMIDSKYEWGANVLSKP